MSNGKWKGSKVFVDNICHAPSTTCVVVAMPRQRRVSSLPCPANDVCRCCYAPSTSCVVVPCPVVSSCHARWRRCVVVDVACRHRCVSSCHARRRRCVVVRRRHVLSCVVDDVSSLCVVVVVCCRCALLLLLLWHVVIVVRRHWWVCSSFRISSKIYI